MNFCHWWKIRALFIAVTDRLRLNVSLVFLSQLCSPFPYLVSRSSSAFRSCRARCSSRRRRRGAQITWTVFHGHCLHIHCDTSLRALGNEHETWRNDKKVKIFSLSRLPTSLPWGFVIVLSLVGVELISRVGVFGSHQVKFPLLISKTDTHFPEASVYLHISTF